MSVTMILQLVTLFHNEIGNLFCFILPVPSHFFFFFFFNEDLESDAYVLID